MSSNSGPEFVLPEACRDAIRKWGNSFFSPTIPRNFIDRSVINEVVIERAKVLHAKLLYGKRRGVMAEIPYNGSKIVNNTDDLSVETLWQYGGDRYCRVPDGFIKKKLDSFYVSTGEHHRCGECKGRGSITHWICDGKGYRMEDVGEGRKKRVDCSCDNGKVTCDNCDGYGDVEVVIDVSTTFDLRSQSVCDYTGMVDQNKLALSGGEVIFDESVDYPKDKMMIMLQGGIDPQEYMRLQENVLALFKYHINSKLGGYDGDISMVYRLVGDFLVKMPNPCEENILLKSEILPARISFKIIDIPVRKISYMYKEKSYDLWVYGDGNSVYAPKYPRGITWKLIAQVSVVGLILILLL